MIVVGEGKISIEDEVVPSAGGTWKAKELSE